MHVIDLTVLTIGIISYNANKFNDFVKKSIKNVKIVAFMILNIL